MEKLIFEVVHGSQAFGLSEPTSDVDIKGIYVAPVSCYCGYLPSPEQIQISKDHQRFEIRKFFRLAAEANPTMLEMLWAPESCVIYISEAGKRIVNARSLFLSKRVADSFGSYAVSQLKRIKTHRRWLMKPPASEPKRSDFGLPERSLISHDQMGAADSLIQRGEMNDDMLSPNFLDIMNRERRYRVARREWTQYNSWKIQRNPSRARLEEEFGYDTKHALHLVRLLRMSIEILATGTVVVSRPDREELLQIKRGTWTFDALVEYSEKISERLNEERNRSRLPEFPDKEKLNQLCTEIVQEVQFVHGS
ncbi:MAG: nucleotidyltransferase domain-containing protein [Candidatus Riflebacteria bacterium]|nr:nucleotidyltransferase domain-containing protein [Candidatus Riflebacteria bacterium]